MKLVSLANAGIQEDAVSLATYLVDRRGLSSDELQRAVALQRAQEIGFSDAVLQLGLATKTSLDVARSTQHDASLPMQGAVSAELRSYMQADSLEARHLGALRAALILRSESAPGVRLAVVSPDRGDGRSHLAAALALSCARLEQPTLLIDAALRRPVQHRLFGIANESGLAQALKGSSVPRLQGVQGMPHLAVLPAGAAVDNPLELLTGRLLGDLIRSYGLHYRHIIIDTTDAESSFDGIAAAIAIGTALLVTRRDHTSLDASERLVARIRATPVQLIGGVLNVVDAA
ncbi:MAG: CpsD/CapB family tyrosine-protein kinase [Pseudomonadota bacterium]